MKTQAARNAGIRVGDYLARAGGREVKTGQDVRDAVRDTSENGEIRCRFLRRHVEGEDTWIDIAKINTRTGKCGQTWSTNAIILH